MADKVKDDERREIEEALGHPIPEDAQVFSIDLDGVAPEEVPEEVRKVIEQIEAAMQEHAREASAQRPQIEQIGERLAIAIRTAVDPEKTGAPLEKICTILNTEDLNTGEQIMVLIALLAQAVLGCIQRPTNEKLAAHSCAIGQLFQGALWKLYTQQTAAMAERGDAPLQ